MRLQADIFRRGLTETLSSIPRTFRRSSLGSGLLMRTLTRDDMLKSARSWAEAYLLLCLAKEGWKR